MLDFWCQFSVHIYLAHIECYEKFFVGYEIQHWIVNRKMSVSKWLQFPLILIKLSVINYDKCVINFWWSGRMKGFCLDGEGALQYKYVSLICKQIHKPITTSIQEDKSFCWGFYLCSCNIICWNVWCPVHISSDKFI